MTEEGTHSVVADKKGMKKEGKKRVREESDSEVVEVAMPPRKKSSGQELGVQWKKWVVERLEIAEARSERLEEAVRNIGQTLESVCGILRRIEEGVPDDSELGSDTEAEQTLKDVGEELEKADEKSEKESEEKSEEVGDVEMVE